MLKRKWNVKICIVDDAELAVQTKTSAQMGVYLGEKSY